MQGNLFTAKDARDAKEKQKQKNIPEEETCDWRLILARRLAVSPNLFSLVFGFPSRPWRPWR
jgi:hypothetical protein